MVSITVVVIFIAVGILSLFILSNFVDGFIWKGILIGGGVIFTLGGLYYLHSLFTDAGITNVDLSLPTVEVTAPKISFSRSRQPTVNSFDQQSFIEPSTVTRGSQIGNVRRYAF